MLAKKSLWISLVAVFFVSGCAVQRYAVNSEFAASQSSPQKLKAIVLPADIVVAEISAGGVIEKVEEWSTQAKSNIDKSLQSAAASSERLQLLELPPLTHAEKDVVDHHLALYDVVGGTAFFLGRSQDPVWAHKAKNFDYTLGEGLSFLQQKTGADVALVVVGRDHISSGGRKATMLLAALFGVILPTGPAFLTVGVVNLKSGNILWLNYNLSVGDLDMRKPEDADAMVKSIFKDYPKTVAAGS